MLSSFNLKKKLNTKKKGFSGITHCLISLLIFEIIWLIPLFSFLVQPIKDAKIWIKIFYWGIVIGAALLPDLDNNISSAGYTLGIIGKLFHTFMVSSSSLIYTLIRTKKDQTKTQHRMFWHTPLSCGLLYLYCWYVCKKLPDQTILELIKSKTLPPFGVMVNMIFLYVIVSCSFILFLSKLGYNLSKFIKNGARIVTKIISTGFFIYLIFAGHKNFMLQMCQAVCLGTLFHNIGDLFSKGSIPLIFPIPIKGQFWFKPRFPFQIETNGAANRILDIILWIVDITLGVMIIWGKDVILNLIK